MAPMKQTLAPSVTNRDPKGRKFMDIVAAAYDKAGLSDGPDGEAQRVNNASGLSDLIAGFIAGNRFPDKFKDQVVSSSRTYPASYKCPRPIGEQVDLVAKIFGLNPADAKECIANVLPTLVPPTDMGVGAEGWFAFPSPYAVASKLFPEVTEPKERMCRLVNLVLDKLEKSRNFKNWRKGEITADRYRLHDRTVEAFERLAAEQKGDIWIIPAQLGMLHRGQSVNRALEVLVDGEFPLGAFLICALALIHPERLDKADELDMDCGDQFAPGADGVFSGSCGLCFGDWRVGERAGFGARDAGFAIGYFGLASGFFPRRK